MSPAAHTTMCTKSTPRRVYAVGGVSDTDLHYHPRIMFSRVHARRSDCVCLLPNFGRSAGARLLWSQTTFKCHSRALTQEHAARRYLLLEDADTGDMMMPLVYMKNVFQANYSRKLSSLKHRLVAVPADAQLLDVRANAYLYWRWAFEAPPNVKLLVRQELGEDNTPQVCPDHGCWAMQIPEDLLTAVHNGHIKSGQECNYDESAYAAHSRWLGRDSLV